MNIKRIIKISFIVFGAFIALIIIIGVSTGGDKKSTTQTQNPQPEQAQTPQSKQTIDANNITQPAITNIQKQYQEVFTFSGNGQKKSEPFNIQGERFKIAYDCNGEPSYTLCTAFVYKVGSPFPQGVMNTMQSTKDETVIYSSLAGKGEYYIDANVLGNFTMTVYDYK